MSKVFLKNSGRAASSSLSGLGNKRGAEPISRYEIPTAT